MKIKNLILVGILLCSLTTLFAQGSWMPAAANFDYPRTLLQESDRVTVQNRLSNPPYTQLYAGSYGNGLATPPGNNNSSNRRKRAKMARNAAFCAYINRGHNSGTIFTLDPADSIALIQKSIDILEGLSTQVPQAIDYTDWQWHSKELIDYLIAYDLLKGAGVPNDSLTLVQTQLQTFVGNLYAEATFTFIGLNFFNTVRNNHSLMTTSALGMAAVVLNDLESADPNQQPQNWINAAMWNLDNVMWEDAARMSEPDTLAGYFEGPYYFKYAFLNMGRFFKAMGHFAPSSPLDYTYSGSTRNIPNPWFDERYDRIYQWLVNIRMPDGRMPSIGDSYVDVTFPELAMLEKPEYLSPLYFDDFDSNQANNLARQLNSTVEMYADYVCSYDGQMTAEPPLFWASPISGDLVFRSATDSSAIYMHQSGQNGIARSSGAGHNQSDETSFILNAYGRRMVIDPGYLSYTRRAEVGQANNHSMILVDEGGPAIGEPGTPNGTNAFIQHTFDTENLDGGEISTAYSGADITRNTLFVRNRYFLMTDQMRSANPHTYTHQIHGNALEATGEMTLDDANHRADYYFDPLVSPNPGLYLACLVQAHGGNLSHAADSSIHEVIYETEEYHTAFNSNLNADNGSFLSILFPYEFLAQPNVTDLSNNDFAAFRLDEGGYKDVIYAQNGNANIILDKGSSTLPADIVSDASMAFVSVDAQNDWETVFMQQMTSFVYGDSFAISATTPVNFLLQPNASAGFDGYVSDSSSIRILLPCCVVGVSGSGFETAYFDSVTREAVLFFNEETNFTLEMGDVVSVEEELLEDEAVNYGNPVADVLQIQFESKGRGESVLEIHDLQGRVLKQQAVRLQTGTNQLQIQVDELPSGLYMWELAGKAFKFVKL